MKGFIRFLGVVCAFATALCIAKLVFEVIDSSAKKYYTVDRGF